MARQTYDDVTKAAVMAALLAGQAVNEVAKQYSVNPSTVRNWANAQKLTDAIDQDQRYEIGDMLLMYLRESLNALRLQAIHFGTKAWLDNQNAADLAVLHGVTADKALRIIEALTAGSEAQEE
jgi:transposase-like protein